MNNKINKKIIVIVTVLLIAVIGAVLVLSNKQPQANLERTEAEKYETLIIEYGEKVKSDIFTVITDKKKVKVRIVDLDTKKLGESEYPALTDSGKEVKITVNVKDTQFPIIKGKDKFTINLGEQVDLSKELEASDPVDGKLSLTYDLPNLDKAQQYKVLVLATDINNNQSFKNIIIEVLNNKDSTSDSGSLTKEEDSQSSPKPIEPAPKITYKETVIYKDLPYSQSIVYDDTILEGIEKVTKEGRMGQEKITTTIKYANGSEVSRSSEKVIIKNPVNSILTVGSKQAQKPPEKLNVVLSGQEIVKMLNDINADRAKLELTPLSVSVELSRAAGIRVEEITESFSHTRPDGSPFHTVSSLAYGENLAYGSSDGSVTHERFMNSQGHKENILRSRWRIVGIASVRPAGFPTYWVVLFGE